MTKSDKIAGFWRWEFRGIGQDRLFGLPLLRSSAAPPYGVIQEEKNFTELYKGGYEVLIEFNTDQLWTACSSTTRPKSDQCLEPS